MHYLPLLDFHAVVRAQRRQSALIAAADGIKLPLTVVSVPVSYTHLDVYKRQGKDSSSLKHGTTTLILSLFIVLFMRHTPFSENPVLAGSIVERYCNHADQNLRNHRSDSHIRNQH